MQRFIFFGTGANFSLKVIEKLVDLDCLPSMIAVPEFPPADNVQQEVFKVQRADSHNALVEYADQLNIPLLYAPRYNNEKVCKVLRSEKFEFLLVACWPYKINNNVYKAVSKAAMNLHPSMLPAYRGKNPVLDQLQNREEHGGVSLHLLNDDIDAGDIVGNRSFEIPPNASRGNIEETAATLGAEIFIKACGQYGGPGWHPRPQSNA